MFSPAVLDHFHNPRNVGPLDGFTHRGVAGSPGDGPHMVLSFRYDSADSCPGNGGGGSGPRCEGMGAPGPWPLDDQTQAFPDMQGGTYTLDPEIILKAKKFNLNLSFYYMSNLVMSTEFGR